MPYIKPSQRFERIIQNPWTSGELNFAITTLIERYRLYNGDSYDTFNSIEGALQCASKEFYRRVVAGYEDKKKEANGDVYRP